jgi:hypothetical protein
MGGIVDGWKEKAAYGGSAALQTLDAVGKINIGVATASAIISALTVSLFFDALPPLEASIEDQRAATARTFQDRSGRLAYLVLIATSAALALGGMVRSARLLTRRCAVHARNPLRPPPPSRAARSHARTLPNRPPTLCLCLAGLISSDLIMAALLLSFFRCTLLTLTLTQLLAGRNSATASTCRPHAAAQLLASGAVALAMPLRFISVSVSCLCLAGLMRLALALGVEREPFWVVGTVFVVVMLTVFSAVLQGVDAVLIANGGGAARVDAAAEAAEEEVAAAGAPTTRDTRE